MLNSLIKVVLVHFYLNLFTQSARTTMANKTIKDFGLAFNSRGQLRQLNPDTGDLTDKPFQFEISPTSTRSENQKNYEELGEVITEYVYEMLDKHGMHRLYFPDDVPESKATFVFATQKKLQEPEKLMVIIHGSGVVRAGQWARSLIINHSLDSGTVLPYIKRAQEHGFEVIVTNTNDNKRDGKEIAGSRNPEEHIQTVWKKFVQPSYAKTIVIVAHSYGGHLVCELANAFHDDFEKKVVAVALTDSVHCSRAVSKRLATIGINYVSSDKPLGTPERFYSEDMARVSAGHIKHEMTSWSCMKALFDFINERYKIEEFNAHAIPRSPEGRKLSSSEL